jgi:hypothetical protein
MNLHKLTIFTLVEVTTCTLEGSLTNFCKVLSYIYMVTPLVNIMNFQIPNLTTFTTMLDQTHTYKTWAYMRQKIYVQLHD